MNGGPTRLEHDWYPGLIPANVRVGSNVYLDTSYGFAPFGSELDPGLELGEASGAYDRTSFVVGSRGRVIVGSYTCLNGTYIVCEERVEIGSYCFLAWGTVITDSWPGPGIPLAARRAPSARPPPTRDAASRPPGGPAPSRSRTTSGSVSAP